MSVENLKPEHRMFAQKYVEYYCNGTKAYMAVYPDSSYESAKSSAADLLTNPNIKEYIIYLQNNIEEANILSIKQTMKWLSEVVNNDNQEEIYIKDKEGNEILVGSKNADLNTKLKAIETLNKMKGVYTQKVEVQGDMNLNNPLRELSTEEIVEMINNDK